MGSGWALAADSDYGTGMQVNPHESGIGAILLLWGCERD
jgi:hypothetical protein